MAKPKIETINLVYKGDIIDKGAFHDNQEVVNKLHFWLHNIKPAIKRGERVTIEIELIGN